MVRENACPRYCAVIITEMNEKSKGVRFGFDGVSIRQRAKALAAFGDWERREHTRLSHLDPGRDIGIIGELLELLPEESRQRPIDTSGVQRLHEILSKMPRFKVQ